MKLVVGLGNPGPQYAKTRHNAGFMLIDRLTPPGAVPKSRFQSSLIDAELAGQRCLLLKPLTFMNRSGQAVAEALAFYKLSPASDLLVIVDDLYLPSGSLRLRPSGGTGGHNGLEDITRALATDAYPRLRIGVGMLPSGGKPAHFDQADYVLSRFDDDELPLVESAIKRAAPGVELWATKGLTAAMNRLNAPDPAPPKSPPPP
ncbi:MAG: aminoacyl-tRNA hydrolase [Leptolyngbya sp. PLA1]|nr:aminoacyl-tRNA hydrolase [Leptolyngbya sp. PLA1]